MSRTFQRNFLRFPEFKRKAVTFSYDDGVPQDKKLIEIMTANGLKGTFNINSELFEEASKTNRFRLSKEEVLETYGNTGNEIAVHGAKHLSLPDVENSVAVNEVISDRRNLEKLFGRLINGMAYAYGTYNDKIINLLKACGIVYARTVNDSLSFDLPTDWLQLSPTCHHNHPKLMELAKTFVEDKGSANCWLNKPMLFYVWGHSFEFDRDRNWDLMEKFAAYVGNRKDVWYATNGEIFEYVSAYDSLKFGVENELCFNPTATDVYLQYFDKEIKVPAGKTVSLKG